jgi:hypothetical protein
VVPENLDYPLVPQSQYIGAVAVHFKEQAATTAKVDSNASLVVENLDTGNGLHQQAIKQVDTVFARTGKGPGERKTTESRQQTGLDKERLGAVVELGEEFVFALAKARNQRISF